MVILLSVFRIITQLLIQLFNFPRYLLLLTRGVQVEYKQGNPENSDYNTDKH